MYELCEFNSHPFAFTLAPTPPLKPARNRFTAVIGSNGSGKSQLLRHVALAAAGDHRYPDAMSGDSSDFDPPSRVFALTNLITDVFPMPSERRSGYTYLGLRQATNSVNTGALRHASDLSIIRCLAERQRAEQLMPVLDQLGFSNIHISLAPHRRPRTRNRDDLATWLGPRKARDERSEVDWSRIERDLDEIERSTRNEGPSIMDEELARQLESVASQNMLTVEQLLRGLNSVNGIKLHTTLSRGLEEVALEQLSAGQLMLLSTVSRIIANVIPNSLVLLDEPESGLHPNWQSDFIPIVKESTKDELGCHFILATHSPHVTSDADDVLVSSDTWGSFEEYDEPFFGRSVENVLYRVFGARVSGNAMVENDLERLLALTSKVELNSDELDSARTVVRRLSRISGADTVKLNEILEQVRRAIGEEA